MRTILLSAILATSVLAAGCDDGCGERTRLPESRAILLHPDSSAFSAVAPDTFYVKMETSKGDIVIQVVKEWAPNGATRFYNLVRNGFYDGDKFFRVVEGFAAQFGVTGYPKVDAVWGKRELPADPIVVKNMRGMVSYAQASPDKRTTQLFFNLSDNANLDAQKFAPIGRIVSGWSAARALNDEYGDLPPEGHGPSWNCVYKAGNKYMARYYPKLDSITRARLMEPEPDSTRADSARIGSGR